MKVYIPFKMIVDTDSGILRLIEKVQQVPEYSINEMKSFLLNRGKENPVIDFNKERKLEIMEQVYDEILDRFYEKILPLSLTTDLISFIINTYKLGFSNELEITIACNYELEMEYLKSITSSLPYSLNMEFNTDLNLNRFDCIFIKYLDEFMVDYLIDIIKLEGKRIYVADYNFNTLYDTESKTKIIDPYLHLKLESNGNIVSLVSLYNKK